MYVSGETSVLLLKSYYLENVTFRSNLGAAVLFLFGRTLEFVNVNIVNNTGLHSGGIIVSNSISFQEKSNFTNVTFHGNRYTDKNGGAVYIQTRTCSSTIVSLCHVQFNDKSQFIFFTSFRCARHYEAYYNTSGRCGQNKRQLRTLPYHLKFSDSTIRVFPGQHISISSIVTDYFGNSANCVASPSLESLRVNFQIKIYQMQLMLKEIVKSSYKLPVKELD